MLDLPRESCGRSGRSRWCQSCAGCQSTRLCGGSTGGPGSGASHTPWSNHSPRGWSCSGWSRGAGQHSRSCTHGADPGNFCPRRIWSANVLSKHWLIITSHDAQNISRLTCFHSVFSVATHLTFPIVILVGARLMLNRRSLCRCPFILSSCVMAQHKVLSSK